MITYTKCNLIVYGNVLSARPSICLCDELITQFYIKLQDEKETKCPACELYKEESAKTFLYTLQHFLEQMNAEKMCATKGN